MAHGNSIHAWTPKVVQGEGLKTCLNWLSTLIGQWLNALVIIMDFSPMKLMGIVIFLEESLL